MKKYLAWLPALCIAAAIFFFSAQPADVSTEVSSGVTRLLLAVAMKLNLMQAAPERLYELCELLSTPVRKCAHITEFSVLHVSVLFGLRQWGFSGKKWLRTALMATVFYACTDEFHQIFVPGRAGMIQDVMIDSIGAAIITAALWYRFVKQNQRRRFSTLRKL